MERNVLVLVFLVSSLNVFVLHNEDRFCNTIATVVLIYPAIRSE